MPYNCQYLIQKCNIYPKIHSKQSTGYNLNKLGGSICWKRIQEVKH